MQTDKLTKVLDFVKKSGEKAILFQDEGEFVVMSLDNYQRISAPGTDVKDLTEAELLNKINREIALWRESQTDEQAEVIKQERQIEDNTPKYDNLDNFKSAPILDEQDENSDLPSIPFDDLEFDPEDITDEEIEDFDWDKDFGEGEDEYDNEYQTEKINEIVDDQSRNNFGYSNPTDSDINQLNDIPPPPDITKK